MVRSAFNTAPGGGTSIVRTLTVRNAAPVLDSIAPLAVAAMRDTVITAYGSGFNLTSQFRLIRGATTVTLAIVSLPSSGVARLSIPAAAIITLATYQVRVFNAAPGGGTSVARNLVVQGGPAVSMEFLNVTTSIVAGASLNAIAPGVQVRFRDALGVLSDVTADSLYATRLPDAALQDTVRKGLRLTRLSAGLYSVPSTVFTTAGTFSLALETQQMAAMTLTTFIGNRSFIVRPTVRANVWIEFFNAADSAITSLTATTSLAKINIRYRDRFQNLTDSTVGIVRLLTVAGNPWGASTATLNMQRTSLGLYNLAAPLQITTAGTYYLNPAGLSRAVVLTTAMDSLVVAPAAPTAYIRSLCSLVNAGASQPAFTIIVRDAGSNRIDLVAPRLTYTQLDTLPTGEHVTGEWTLTRTALGTYTAPAQLFTVGGLYSFQMTDGILSVPVSASGLTPDTVFTVLSSVATRLAIADADTAVSPLLPDTLRAGGVMPRLRFAFRDASGNLTDNGVTLTSATYRVAVGASSGTLRLERESVGLYWTSSTFASAFVTAGTYTITVRGIQIDSITVNGIQPGRRTFVVAPLPASSVLFTGLLPTLTSGAAQTRFRATLRDTFNNLTDNVQTDSVTALPLTQVWYSMSTDATVTDSTRQASAGLFTMQRTSLGVFLADVHAPITEAGNYAIGVQGITSTSGTAAFTVRPNVDYRIVFENVPDTLTAGDSVSNVVVRYFDINDNPTDNSLGRILYTRTGGSSTATIQNTRIGTGVYALTTTQATLAGTYTLSVSGIANVNYQGNRVFVLRPAPAASVQFTSVTPIITAGGNQAAFRLQLRDRFGNATNDAGAVAVDTVRYTNATTGSLAVSSGTIALAGAGVGLFTAAVTRFNTSGNYTLALNGAIGSIGTMNFNVQSAVARTVEFADVPDTLWTAQPLPPVLVRFRDLYGNLTNDNRPVTFTKTGSPASTGTIALNPLGTGVYTTAGTVFWRSGNYTLSVSGIAVANSLGKRTFFVKPDTALPLLLTTVTPQSLSVGDSAVHNWTLTLTGDNFNTSSAVYGRNNNTLFPTTFVDETTLTVIVPPALRQLGAMMLEVRSSAPPSISNMIPVFVFDPSLEYHATLETISPQQPILTAQEQTALTTLQQSGQYVSVRAIKLDVRPVDILTTRELTFTVAPGVVATAELGYPQQVGENDYYVRGYVQGDTTGKEFAVTMVDNRYIGTQFTAGGKDYVIQPLGNNGVHFLGEVNQMAPIHGCGLETNNVVDFQPPPPPISTCDNRTIRVLFLATPEIISNISFPSVLTSLKTQIQYAKDIYRRSLVWTSRQTVNIEEVNDTPILWNYNSGAEQYANERIWINDLLAVSPPPQNMDVYGERMIRSRKILVKNLEIQQLKEQYKADVVVILHLSPADGLGNEGNAIQSADLAFGGVEPTPDNAFILMRYREWNYTTRGLFAHELGHILGGHHHNSTAIFPSSKPRYGFFQEYPSPFQQGVNLARTTIMAVGADPTSDIFSSPALVEEGVSLAVRRDNGFLLFSNTPVEYTTAPLANLATNTNLLTPLSNPIPLGTITRNDVTSIIDMNAPIVAAYTPSSLSIDIRNMPKTLRRGESAPIEVILKGCQANTHLFEVYRWSATQRLGFTRQYFTGNEYRFTETVGMPTDVTHGLNFYNYLVTLQTVPEQNVDGYGLPNYETTNSWQFISCRDCYPEPQNGKVAYLANASHNRPITERLPRPSEEVHTVNLLPNYPNPVLGNETTIEFTLTDDSQIELSLYNAMGQLIQTILQGNLFSGNHKATIDTKNLASGAYQYRLKVGSRILSRSMIIAK